MPLAATAPIVNADRLAALNATGLLDAPPQEALDRLTRLATRLVGVPVALVSFVDDDRQFFASQVGLAEPWATARETPLTHSFCQHVVATRKALVVEDSRVHPLVSDNLAIPDLGVIAYAGIPLTSDTGEVLGSFCAIDTAPRHWTEDELEILEDLAHAASAEIQLRAASRLLASRQTFLADLLDHTGELVCATDAQGFIVYANRAMLESTGYTTDELAHMRAGQVIAPETRDSFMAAGAGLLTKGTVVEGLETIVVAKDGQRLYCHGRATPVVGDDGSISGVRIIFRDLTKEREAQRLKDELIALVSHELRTPVGAIRGALKFLIPHVAHFDGRPRQLFDMATRNAERLLKLVNDLLDIERIESGMTQMVMQTVSVSSVLEQTRDAMAPLAENAEVTLSVHANPALVRIDDARIQQVLINLVGNAIKFSPAGSTISLSARPSDKDESLMAFCVEDQGRGIPEDKLAAVFERFEQVMASDASEKGGAGLGLAISKAIVEQHGGTIWVESAVGEGSRFWFTVPRA